MKYQFCPVCGCIDEFELDKFELDKCGYCNSKLVKTDIECDMFDYWDNKEEIDAMIYEKYDIENNPLYNLDAVEKRKDDEQTANKVAHMSSTSNHISCPYCHSANVSKISTINRVASVGVFGLASKKNRQAIPL